MSKSRDVYTGFWTDPLVSEEMTPEDRLFFIYLLTNRSTTEIGIYQITRRRMAFDLGHSLETIDALLERFIHRFDIVRYNRETSEIALKNWGRHNLRHASKPIIDCVTSELARVKDRSLIPYVGERVHNKTIKALFLGESCGELNETEDATSEELAEEVIDLEDIVQEQMLEDYENQWE